MQNLEYFIDSHCHMFTIADIPLYETIRQAAHDKLGPAKRTFLPLVSFMLPLIDPDEKVQKLEKFMRYFENEPCDSVRQLCKEVDDLMTLGGNVTYRFAAKNTVLTPLVMDFDMGGRILASGRKSKLAGQVQRLCDAIKQVSPQKVKVLPFMGIDPERPDFDHWLDKAQSVQGRGGFAAAQNGDFIGIKLYPSLGFSPLEHLPRYKTMAEKGLPVTVHCQKDGLKLEKDGDSLTDPKNWEAVLAALKAEGIDLTINFAHFGGEDGVMATAAFRDRPPEDASTPLRIFDELRKNTWTRSIIRMLKTYPNAYSDLSAFNFSDKEAIGSLKWILHFDAQREFDVAGAANYPLIDKLMWGSDYPMTLTGAEVTYTCIFNEFVRAIDSQSSNDHQYPPPIALPTEAFINKLVCENPRKFLGL